MCMVYNKAGKPSYARACYRTGQKGRHVPIAEAVWGEHGHLLLNTSEAGQIAEVPDGLMLHFSVGVPNPEGEADMARYAHARALHVTELAGRRYVSLHVDRASENAIRRARSFGWRQVPHQEGLPVVPTKTAAAKKSRRRTLTWHLIAMFDRQPAEVELQRLYGVLDDDPARRWWKHTILGTWQLNVWRNVGWARSELAECWKGVGDLGGRPYQSGDDPDVRTYEDLHI